MCYLCIRLFPAFYLYKCIIKCKNKKYYIARTDHNPVVETLERQNYTPYIHKHTTAYSPRVLAWYRHCNKSGGVKLVL